MTTAIGARAVRRAARASWCRSCAPSPSSRLADDSCLRGDVPRSRRSSTFGLSRHQALRLRPRARAARQDASSVLHQVLARRRAHHHARARERPRRGAVLDAARGRPRALRAGRRRRRSRARRSARAPRPACTRASRGCGRTWSAAAAASGSISIRSCATPSPTSSQRVPLETFYRAINKVERSLIRTDADEVTYNLHVMMRFDLELELLEGRLAVKDLPEAWRARFEADFGIAPPDDRDGCLQDVHWYAGGVGGALPGLHHRQHPERAVLRRGARAPIPRSPREMAQGEFATLHGWLREQHLPARAQVHARRAGRARHRRPHEHRALHRLPARQVRRALSAGVGSRPFR